MYLCCTTIWPAATQEQYTDQADIYALSLIGAWHGTVAQHFRDNQGYLYESVIDSPVEIEVYFTCC